MYKNSSTLLLIALSSSLLWLNGCVPSYRNCSNNASESGYFCYKGYNFGRYKSAQYKRGVKDGCNTARGFFVKNYTLAKNIPLYVKGWDRGRATCKLVIPQEAEVGTMRTQYQQSIDEKKYYGR